MRGDTPFMLLRARTKPGAAARFDRWFREVHLRDVEKIPGVVSVRGGRTAGGTQLGLYEFAAAEVVQAALGSPEAAYARGTWEQWAGDLEELLIEMWAPVGPALLFREMN
ncbi:MAG: hypothetical protein IT304_00820 [Dehalococcoidia bacterium]|nr:hypothetical protein [Dehalococcoidia bacterium]